MIGRLGGGDHKDRFNEQTKILICVLNSAAAYLPGLASQSKHEQNLLLVADECHRAGGATFMQRIFFNKKILQPRPLRYPGKEDQYDTGQTGETHYNQSLLGQELGPIIFELTVREALEQGILPEFEIHHYGLPLQAGEREKYENLSRRIRDTTKELKELGYQHGIHDSNIVRRTQELAKRHDDLGTLAKQHLYLTNQRRHLLYNSTSRQKAVLAILQTEFQTDSTTRALLFHESIESVMLLYNELLNAQFPAAVEHSQLPDSVRKTSIELFREGIAQIIVSARSLIEGFNVPETDIGIIVASSTSVRQRIQTIGRLLRKSKDKKKTATIYVLYMADTIDEYIYGKTDWDNLLGSKRNRYFILDNRGGELQEQEEPPRTPLPRENDLPPEILDLGGGEYPGVYEGAEYTCDSDGNVFTANGGLIKNPQGVPELIRKTRGGSYGRFKVTPGRLYILVQAFEEEEWLIKFAGQLQEPFVTGGAQAGGLLKNRKLSNYPNLSWGGSFSLRACGQRRSTYLSQAKPGGKNGTSQKKEGRGGWRFARLGEQAAEPNKGGEDGNNLLQAAVQYRKSYPPQLSKMLLTKQGHAVVLKEGEYRYIATLKVGLEFP